MTPPRGAGLAVSATWQYHSRQMATTTKRHGADVEALLGGAALVYGRGARGGELHEAVRDGLPFHSLEKVAEALALRSVELGDLIGMAPRTLARRKHEKALTAVESDRLVGVARLASLAEDVLGSREQARGWLRDPNRALGGVTPLSCLDTEPGRRRVEATLLQIRYGIVS
jgi:putative toxin-antitoxin system antitoxin component (TIGR02293 family)